MPVTENTEVNRIDIHSQGGYPEERELQILYLVFVTILTKEAHKMPDTTCLTPDDQYGGLLRVPEVAQYLGVSRPLVYRLIGDGKLRSVKIRGSRRVPRFDVLQLIEKSIV